jgi:hypothetical protein
MADITSTENLNKVNALCVDNYVAEFNHFAKQNLGKDFGKFCSLIRFEEKSSAIRKLEQIGRKADFLEKYADHLPNTWTTVYRLTMLNESTFEEAVRVEDIKPAMTGLKAGELLAKQNGTFSCSKKNIKQLAAAIPVAANDATYEITLRFDGVPDRAKVQNLEMVVNGLAATTGNCNVIRSQWLEVLMQDQPQVAA